MRYLLIDRVVEFEAEASVVALKNVTLESPYLAHHFPGVPIFPGALQIEAMAQAVGYLLARSAIEAGREACLPLLQSVRGCRFLRPVLPGDQLRIEATLSSLAPRLARAAVCARVDGVVASRSDLSFVLADASVLPTEVDGVALRGTLASLHGTLERRSLAGLLTGDRS